MSHRDQAQDALDPEALRAELTERLTSALAEASRRKQERAEQRAQFARDRSFGLTQRHGRKLHAQQRRRR